MGSPQPACGMLSLPSCWGCCLEQHQPPQISPHARGVPDAGPWGRLINPGAGLRATRSKHWGQHQEQERKSRGQGGAAALPGSAAARPGPAGPQPRPERREEVLRNGDFLLLPALIWAAALSAPGWARFGYPQGAGTRGKGTPPPQPGHGSTQSTATCLASFSPPSLKISSPSDPGRWREINAGGSELPLIQGLYLRAQ